MPLTGERKQVTVLFADLKDSLALIRGLAPEATQQLLEPALPAMMDAVHRYEGTVNQVLGDGIMALFGAPIVHEDHAIRACYAALGAYAGEMYRAHGLTCRVASASTLGQSWCAPYRDPGPLAHALPTMQVPATVQAVLAARIDRLPLEEKHLLETAAVLGMEVLLPLLQAVVELPEEALRLGLMHLQDAEFLYETYLFPELVYTFKHALTQEVAYGSLLQERRRGLHARIVEALEALTGDRLAEPVERLRPTMPCGVKCGTRSWRTTGRQGRRPWRALAFSCEHQERGHQAYALRLLGEIAVQRDPPEVASAEASDQQALALANELGMRPLQAHCHRGLGTLYGLVGREPQARAALSTAVELYRAMAMTFWLPQAEAALAQVEAASAPQAG